MTERVRVAVIGGGAVGCSVLYHLALRGWTDTLLIEQDELTSGSTWHAAGNCPTFAASWALMRLQAYSAALYRRLASDEQHPIAYHVTGSVRLAHTAARMDEFAHVAGMARAQGLGYALLSPAELRERHPLCETDGLLGALWDPCDGDIDPAQLTQALAAHARALGATVRRFTKVTSLAHEGGAWRVGTTAGGVVADIVVNAAGYRAGELMALLGRHLPTVAMSHQYVVTGDAPELSLASRLPLLRDPDVSYYLRQERTGFILGPYEWDATPMWLDGIPADFAHQLWDDDLERLGPIIEAACARVPALGRAGVRRVVNGPIPYSPDGNPYIGPAHGLPRFFHANTFSFGIAQAGGAGKAMAEWIIDGAPEWDLWAADPRRFGAWATTAHTVAKAVEIYQNEYATVFPAEERPAGRPLATSTLHDRLAAKGARFGARGGWERPTWFGTLPVPPDEDRPSFRRRRAWFDAVGQEVRAVRERAGVLDLPGFTKFQIEGPNAAAWLDAKLCTRLPAVGRLGLSYALDGRGRILSEFTVSRLATDRFYLCSAASAAQHDDDVLRADLPASVRLDDVSAELGTLVLAGPLARAVLAPLTPADLTDGFRWLSVRDILVAGISVTALRVTYVGELGWELHAPMRHLPALYDALWASGSALGLRDFGLHAVDSMRLDKCYRGWKTDLEGGYSPFEASLDRFVDLSKSAFTGRAALLSERQRGVARRMVPLVLDEDGGTDAPPLATLSIADRRIGLVTSGGWSHTLGRSLALAYVDAPHHATGGKVTVDVFGRPRAATIASEPLYDPANARLRA